MPRAQKEVVEFDSSRSSEAEIENFKKKIEIPHSQLQELVYNDSNAPLTQESMSPPLSTLSARE